METSNWIDLAAKQLLKVVLALPRSNVIIETILNQQNEPHLAAESKSTNYFGLAAAAASIIFAVIFFVIRLDEYGQWPPKIYQSKSVVNLTSEKILWDVHYGASKGCDTDACYRREDTPHSFFRRQAVLPLREFPIPDWMPGDPIFYRTTVKIPPEIIARSELEPISLHTIIMFAESWDMYLNDTLVFQGTKETMLAPIPRQYIRDDGTVRISIRAAVGDLPYQGIANKGDILIGPRSKLAPLAFFSRDNSTSLQLLYLLPKLSFCVVFAIIFLIVRQNQEVAWLLAFGLSSSLELFLRSEFSVGLGLKSETTILLAFIMRNYSLLYLARFVAAFFRLKIPALEKFMKWGFMFLTTLNILCLFYFSYQTATKTLDVIAIFMKPCVYLFSVFLAASMAAALSANPRSIIRARIAVLFSVLLVFGTGLSFVDLTNLIANTMNIQFAKISLVNFGWVFDLILFIFMASITGFEMAMQRIQRLELESKLEKIDSHLDLAASVQKSLFPDPLQGTFGNITWACRYIAAERMAGDWIFVGPGRAQNTKFIVGDVTGKGPAAALAVAAIVSYLKSFDSNPDGLESTVKKLNDHLFELFNGKCSSCICAAEIDANGATRVVVHGMLGWIHISKNGVKMATARGSPLGLHTNFQVTANEFSLDIGDTLLCFSDGCLDGAREMRRLIQELGKLNRSTMSLDSIFELVNAIGKNTVLPDDKAMIMLTLG